MLSATAWFPKEAHAGRVMVTKIAGAEVAAETQISIIAAGPVRYQVRDLRADWIVVDITGAELGMASGLVPFARGPVRKLRVGQFTSDTVRVVVELVRRVNYHLRASSDNSIIVIRIPADFGGQSVGTHARSTSPPLSAPTSEKGISPQTQVQTQFTPSKGSEGAQTRPNNIAPGRGIGPVNLGMTIRDVSALNGPSLGIDRGSDGSAAYRWFEPPRNSGLGVRVNASGSIYRVWVLNDPRYVTKEGLRAGSTEADVRAVLGQPSKVWTNLQTKIKTLAYDALGVWFGIQLDERYTFYNRVFEIGVMQPK